MRDVWVPTAFFLLPYEIVFKSLEKLLDERNLKMSARYAMSDFEIIYLYTYRVSHNTWDYKNALGRPLYDNIEIWEVSHFEAKDHTFLTQGVRF
jgi:hypothetical protein